VGGDEETRDVDGKKASARRPPGVVRALEALEKARDAAREDRRRKAGRWLAVLPIGIAALVLLLMMPRATEPDAIPLPRVDRRALRAIAEAGDRRATAAEETRLPSDVLAIGSAIRGLQAAEERGADELERTQAQRQLDAAARDLTRRASLDEELLSLRALQTRRFLDVLSHWERTGDKTPEHLEIAGSFVRRSEEAGWVEPGRRLILDEHQRRVAFKTLWNALAGLEGRGPFALALDEQRALYSLYLERPHLADTHRVVLLAQRRDARTPEACARTNREEARLRELWRVEKIRKLGAIDPAYPAGYALGVGWYRAGRYDLSAEAFTRFLGAHPDGPYALRAKNHLKAALAAHGAL
jgi:hypothetical protein